ncbi:MAG TPA: HlyD family efflux transporter periplasmic adaptor subunit [Bacillota bacterium]|nr:HlyD family efflux transporter periplasmic adaptor subunit [Bacillota bacterium]
MNIHGRTKRPVPGSTKRRKKQHFARWVLGFGLAGALVVFSAVWWGFITVKNSLVSSMVDVQATVQGTLQDTQMVQTILVRDEQLIVATVPGQIKRVVPEGERVRKGALLAYITEKTLETGSGVRDVPVYSPATGIVSYYVDNLEGLATPENLDKLGGQKLFQALENQSSTRTASSDSGSTSEQTTDQAGQTAVAGLQRGQPLCKIVNNLKPTYFLLENSSGKVAAEVYQQQKYVYGNLKADQTEPISFKLQPASRPELLVLSSSAFAPEFIQKRKVQLSIISSQFQGYIIPRGAIVSRNGETGIFIVYKEVASWQPVKIKGEAQGKIAVEAAGKAGSSRLSPNALVVKNPALVQEGQVVSVR